MKRATTCLLFLLFATQAWAQPHFLHERVYDSTQDDLARRHCMVMDASVIFAAGTIDDGNETDLVLWALDLDGNTLWTRTIGGSGDQTPSAIALDGAGGVYVAGTGQGFGASSDYILARYDSAGNQAWIRNFDRGSSDIAAGIAVDASGNVALTGLSHLTEQEAVTVLWDAAGTFQWAAIYGAGAFDGGTHVTFDGAGVVVTGTYRPNTSSQNRSFTARYDSTGGETWSRQFGGSGACSPSGVLVDGAGNCFVSLTQRPLVTSPQQAVVLKYDVAGTLEWSAAYSVGDPAGGDRAEHMVLNPAGGVFLAAESYNGTDWDLHPLAINSATPQLIAVYDSGGHDESEAALIDGLGHLLVAGLHTPTTGGGSGLLVAFDPAGAVEWSLIHGGGNLTRFHGLQRNSAGEIAAYGERFQSDTDLLVVRYRENQVPVASDSVEDAYEDLQSLVSPIASDGDGDTLTYFVLTQPSDGVVAYVGPDLVFWPNQGFIGQTFFTFRAYDGVAYSSAAQVTLNVLARNDAPTFSVPGRTVVPKGTSTVVTVPGFATAMSAGPADEAGQSLQFVVTGNTHAALFTQAPHIDSSTGDLTFQPVGTRGQAVITVVLVDNGGTLHGGSDTSLPGTFTVFVGKPPEPKEQEPACSTETGTGRAAVLLLALLAGACALRRLRRD